MDLRQRVKGLIGNKDSTDLAIKTFTTVQREFKMSRQDLLDTPLPAYYEMINVLVQENKESQKGKGFSRRSTHGLNIG